MPEAKIYFGKKIAQIRFSFESSRLRALTNFSEFEILEPASEQLPKTNNLGGKQVMPIVSVSIPDGDYCVKCPFRHCYELHEWCSAIQDWSNDESITSECPEYSILENKYPTDDKDDDMFLFLRMYYDNELHDGEYDESCYPYKHWRCPGNA